MTRRTLARLLASSAVAPAALISQIPESQPTDDQKIVAEQMRESAGQLNKVKLPMATEPAFRFKA